LGSGKVAAKLWKLLGSTPAILPATDTFRVPFTENHSVRLYVNADHDFDFEYIMTLTDQAADDASVTAFVRILASPSAEKIFVMSVAFVGDGASINTLGAVRSITSAVISGGIIDDAAGGRKFSCTGATGFLAANGDINLASTVHI